MEFLLASDSSSSAGDRDVGWDHHAPQFGDAQQDAPFVVVGDVVDAGEAIEMTLDRVARRQRQEALWVGETLERDAGPFAHDRIRAVRPDQIVGADSFDGDRGFDENADPALILIERQDAPIEAHAAGVHRLELRGHEPRQLILLALQAVGMRRHVGQFAEIEFDDRAGLAIAVMIARRAEAVFLELVEHAEFVEHVERRRVERRGAHVLGATR